MALEQTAQPKSMLRTIISVRHLRKVYRIGDEKVVALGDINLEILQGQIVCIGGTTGSGKSTFVNQLAGLEKPTRGAVYIGKTNISRLSENQLATFRQRYLGFVFQSYNLLPTMTALENVSLPLIFKGAPKALRDKAAMTMLAAVGLKKRAYHRPTQMSGGQQQRVGIARAFVTRPKVIFADEPTGNLDTKTTIDVMKMMVRFARRYRQTLIIVTHDPEIADYADRVVTLIDGAITSDVSHEPIYDGKSEQGQTLLPDELIVPDDEIPQGPIDASEDEPIPPLADTLLFPDSDPADGFHQAGRTPAVKDTDTSQSDPEPPPPASGASTDHPAAPDDARQKGDVSP